MEKNKEEPLGNRSQSTSIRGTKRSAEEGEKAKTDESSTEKRGRRDEKETDERLEKTEEDAENELIDRQDDSSDSSNSEISFMDLPDDCHRNIFSFLDLQSRLKLRVNKRLDRLHFSVKANLTKIKLQVALPRCKLTIDDSKFRYSRFGQCEKVFRLVPQNTSVHNILIIVNTSPNQDHCRVIDALFHFNANYLRISSYHDRTYIPHLTLSSFLTLAQNVRRAYIDIRCTSLTAQDLCIIRKAMLEGSCMKYISMRFNHCMNKNIMEECFGVITEKIFLPFLGTVYRSVNDSHEIYRKVSYRGNARLEQFEGDLKTSVDNHCISFENLKVVEKPDDRFKLRLNHVYGEDDQ